MFNHQTMKPFVTVKAIVDYCLMQGILLTQTTNTQNGHTLICILFERSLITLDDIVSKAIEEDLIPQTLLKNVWQRVYSVEALTQMIYSPYRSSVIDVLEKVKPSEEMIREVQDKHPQALYSLMEEADSEKVQFLKDLIF